MGDRSKTKEVIQAAFRTIREGGIPRSILATNTKTGFSIFDNVPDLACAHICPVREKCYDRKLLKLRPSMLKSRALRHFYMNMKPNGYVEQVKREIRRARTVQVRIYGGGDYTPNQLPMILEVLRTMRDITFYMISKTIRSFPEHAKVLLAEKNFFLNISEMAEYRFEGPAWTALRRHHNVNSVYTLLPDETDFAQARAADIVFNVTKAKKAIQKYKLNKLPLCPCDAKDIPSKGACGDCRLCSTKGGVRLATI